MASEATPAATLLRYTQLASSIDASFWRELASRKLHDYGLSESAAPVVATFSPSARGGDAPAQLCLDAESFGASRAGGRRCVAPGSIHNLNTKDSFKQFDKGGLLRAAGARMWEAITSGAALRDPTLLNAFELLSFADLKRHYFVYWCMFPALIADDGAPFTAIGAPAPLGALAPGMQRALAALEAMPSAFIVRFGDGDAAECAVLPLSALADTTLAEITNNARYAVGFVDPSANPQHPGWPLRNLLMCVAHHVAAEGGEAVRFVSYRDDAARCASDPSLVSRSLVFDVALPVPRATPPRSVGWEKVR